MAVDFNISPYYDDYFSENGGLSKNYYKVLFRPGRALQARELSTAQSILQNQISSLGKAFFPNGDDIYTASKSLHTPLPYVKLKSTLSNTQSLLTTADGDAFLNFSVGDVLKDTVYGIQAKIKAVSPAESNDPDTIWVTYLTSNNEVSVWPANTVLTFANASVEIAMTAATDATGNSHAVTVGDGIIFTKDVFVQSFEDTIILKKYESRYNSRIGYAISNKFVTSDNDITLKDNAQGYPNFTAPGADRQKIALTLCNVGYAEDWISTDVEDWVSTKKYHKNKKVKLSGTSNVFICIKSHVSTSTNSPANLTLGQNDPSNLYWVSINDFVEIDRVENGTWVKSKTESSAAVGFSEETLNAFLEIWRQREFESLGNYTITPQILTVKENFINGLLLANNTVTVANNDQLLVTIDSGKSIVGGKDVITQLPERFLIDKARSGNHIIEEEDFTPQVNYGNYILVENTKGYFNIDSNETVTFYNKKTSDSDWANTANIVGTANIRYFDLHSGNKSANTINGMEMPIFRAYIYNFIGVNPGESKSIKGEFGYADTNVTTTTFSSTANGEINLRTSNVYAQVYDSENNFNVFPLYPGYIRKVSDVNASAEPVLYTTKTIVGKLTKTTSGGVPVYQFKAANNAVITEAILESEVNNGIVDPQNRVDLANENYTLINNSATPIVIGNSFANTTFETGDSISLDLICGETHADFSWTTDVSPYLSIYFPIANDSVAPTTVNDIVLQIKVGLLSITADKKYFRPCRTKTVLYPETTSSQGFDSKTINLLEPDILSIAAIYMTDSLYKTYNATGSANTIVKLTDTTDISSGMLLNGNGFNERQYVVSVDSSTQITVSAAPDETPLNNGNITFINEDPKLPMMDVKIDLLTDPSNWGTEFLVGETLYEVDATSNVPTTITGTLVASMGANTLNSGANTYSFTVGIGSKDNQYFTPGNKIVGTHSKTVATVVSRSINDGVRDVTQRYTFKHGQTYNYLDWSKLELKTSSPAATGSLIIVYNKFDTVYAKANYKSIATVSSYGYFGLPGTADENDFVGYSANTDIKIDYTSLPISADTVDFRPLRNANTAIVDVSTGSFSYINDYSDIYNDNLTILNASPIVGDQFKIDYEYFVGRKDLVVIDKSTDFKIISGIPGGTFPAEPEGSMSMWKISIPPYTNDAGSVSTEMIQNKAYTMKDIASLEKRIEALEDFAKVTDDELTALTKPELSMSAIYKGLERFKNGILLDTFTDFNKADITNPDFKCSIDNSTQTLRSPFDSISIDVDQYSNVSNTKYHNVNSKEFINSANNSVTNVDGIVTLDYTNESYIKQSNFSSQISVNPFNVTSFIGAMKLDPSSDSWMETTVLPDVVVQNPSNVAMTALQKSNNERLEISITNVSGVFTEGLRISTSTGGTGLITEVPSSTMIVVMNHEGKFNDIIDPETGKDPMIYGTNGASAKIVALVPRGGAPGYGTSFGDWKTTWIGEYKEIDRTVIGRSSRTNQVSAVPAGRSFVSADAGGINVAAGGHWERRYHGKGDQGDMYWIVDSTEKVTSDVWKRMTDPSVPSWWGGNASTAAYVLNVHGGTVAETKTTTTTKVTKSATSRDTKTGSRTDMVLKTIQTTEGEKVIDVATIPYMREKEVVFDVKGLKPNTRIIPYFDSINVSSYCYQRSGTSTPWKFSTTNSAVAPLKSDRKGNLQGKFTIPKGVFKTGERKFRLISVTVPENNLEVAATFAESIFVSTGTKETKQRTIISTKVPEIVQKTYSTERVSTSITSENVLSYTYAYSDPLAQTFLIDSASSPEGVFLTALDLYVANTPSTSLPMWVEIRSVENGYPSQVVVPGSKIVYDIDDDLYFNGSSGTYHNGTTILTVKTIEDHNLIQGQYITLQNDGGAYDGIWQISEVVNSKTFKILVSWATVGARQPNTTMSFTKINIADDPNWIPTKFNFEHPVYLQPGEYAFVIQSNDDAYEIYYAEMGGASLVDGKVISRQPYTGSMFKSQNASTWTATQEADIAFNIWRAKFNVGTGSAIFGQNDSTLINLPGSGVELPDGFNIKYSLMNFNSNIILPKSSKITWKAKSMDINGVLSDWYEIDPKDDEVFTIVNKIERGTNSLQIKAEMLTTNDYVSPLIDLTDQRAILIENIINNSVQNEHMPTNGSAQAKYVSKKIILEEGMDAEDVKVTLSAARIKQGSNSSEIKVYSRLFAATDDEKLFDERFWYPMVLTNAPEYSSATNDYKLHEYELPRNIWFVNEGDGEVTMYYTGDGRLFGNVTDNYDDPDTFLDLGVKILEHVSYNKETEQLVYSYYEGTHGSESDPSNVYAEFTSFKEYAIKIVMIADNKALIPVIKEYKALALT